MKRILSIFTVVVLIFCFVGCETTGELKNKLNARIPRGTIEGNVYTSEFTGLKFTKPDRWRFLTDEEISEYMGISLESFDANYFEKAAIDYSTVIDMAVVDNGVGVSAMVTYENLSLTIGKSVSEEGYLTLSEAELKKQGATKKGEAETVTLCGEKYLKATFFYNSSDVPNNSLDIDYESTLYYRLIGDIMTIITITSPVGIVDRNVEAMFS